MDFGFLLVTCVLCLSFPLLLSFYCWGGKSC